jgi:phosphate transport system protein
MPHILRNYDDELGALKNTVVEMGTLAVTAIEKSAGGLLTGDLDLCYDVIDEDEAIDQHEKRIDEQGMSILLRFNPVASDLRHVLSSINIGRSLERIGDHAVTVAKRSRKILKAGKVDEIRLVEPLMVRVRRILSTALVTYSDGDEEMAHTVIKMDEKVDRLYKNFGKRLTRKISEGSDGTESLLNLIFISRSLERIGDLAVNIGEDVVFSASAEDIRHT